ncbi:MAG: ATP synthase F1 subunit epsilon [Verrucomicrobiae bacterium]|nr:ATP synthase F1 subunit epsilon [Verrucomicrobiae bacterium]
MSKLLLEIITPEAKTYSQEVDSVVMPTAEGEVQILPGHVPLMTLVEPGELHVINGSTHEYLAVGTGAAQITGIRVAVMTDMAVKESDIDIGKAEEAIRRAQEALKAKDVGGDSEKALQATIMRMTAQIQVRRRRQM